MSYLVTRGINDNVSYSGTQYQPFTGTTQLGTRRLCLRTGSLVNDVVKYGLTTDSSATQYCKIALCIDGKTARIGRKTTYTAVTGYSTTRASGTGGTTTTATSATTNVTTASRTTTTCSSSSVAVSGHNSRGSTVIQTTRLTNAATFSTTSKITQTSRSNSMNTAFNVTTTSSKSEMVTSFGDYCYINSFTSSTISYLRMSQSWISSLTFSTNNTFFAYYGYTTLATSTCHTGSVSTIQGAYTGYKTITQYDYKNTTTTSTRSTTTSSTQSSTYTTTSVKNTSSHNFNI